MLFEDVLFHEHTLAEFLFIVKAKAKAQFLKSI